MHSLLFERRFETLAAKEGCKFDSDRLISTDLEELFEFAELADNF